MKRILLMVCFALIIFSTTVLATDVQLNGKIIDFTDSNGNKVEAQIINNRTMVPLRKIFEFLGCSVEWDGSTQTVTATKGNKIIVLQINNKIAKKMVDGVEEEIELDSPPVIVNDRTLVPLRFIAESLNKQVGWDGANRTAIIIDYEFFENKLKSDAPALYYFLKDNYDDSKNATVTITRKYTDGDDSSNSNTAKIVANISEKKDETINQNLKLSFSGNNPLMQDIVSEKWNNSSIDIIYDNENVSHKATDVLAKMIGVEKSTPYSQLGFETSGLSELEDGFRGLIGIDEKKINIGTFDMIEQEFNKVCGLFKSTNSNETVENGTKYTWSFNTVALKYDNTKFNYFDLTKLDNIIYNNSYVRAYGYINKNIFKYDVKLDELMYDTSEIKLSGKISVTVGGDNVLATDANVTYKAVDDYNEQFEYSIVIN